MNQGESFVESVTSIYGGFLEMLASIKAVLVTVLQVNHNAMSVVLRFGANLASTVWAILHFLYVIVHTLLGCVFDFLQEFLNFITAFLYLLWKIVVLIYSMLDLIFHALESTFYFLWTGGKWTANTIRLSGQNLSENSLSTWKYFVVSIKELSSSLIGGFSVIGDFFKSFCLFVYNSVCLSYEYIYEFILYTDFYVRYFCRHCFEASYELITEYLFNMRKEAYLGLIISLLVFIIIRNIVQHMRLEGFTFPVTEWFSSSVSDEYDSDYGDFEGDRDEFSDDEEGMNYASTPYHDAENNDEYSINSDVSDESDDDDNSSDSDGELEIDSDSDNESNAASESEMSEINIELPQTEGTFGRRSTTPSRFSKEMSADDLQKIVDDEKERRMCVVCQDRSKSVLILPCRHMCLCVDCGNQIARSRSRERRKCPLCRSKINTIMNVYI